MKGMLLGLLSAILTGAVMLLLSATGIGASRCPSSALLARSEQVQELELTDLAWVSVNARGQVVAFANDHGTVPEIEWCSPGSCPDFGRYQNPTSGVPVNSGSVVATMVEEMTDLEWIDVDQDDVVIAFKAAAPTSECKLRMRYRREGNQLILIEVDCTSPCTAGCVVSNQPDPVDPTITRWSCKCSGTANP